MRTERVQLKRIPNECVGNLGLSNHPDHTERSRGRDVLKLVYRLRFARDGRR